MNESMSDEMVVWHAYADFLSGRPTEAWRLTAHQARQLLTIWDGLALRAHVRPVKLARLGYRGCVVEDDAGRVWQASDSIVTHMAASVHEVRNDPLQAFERFVLTCAPAGFLPEGLLD